MSGSALLHGRKLYVGDVLGAVGAPETPERLIAPVE
jgi:hypothetical protein